MNSEEWLTLCLLAIHSTSITLLMRYAKQQPAESMLDTSLLVCVVEIVKMGLALGIQLWICTTSSLGARKGLAAFTAMVWSEFTDRRRVVLIWAPSIAYAIQNNLFFVALERLTVVEYQIGMQLRVLWAALASMVFLRRRFTPKQWGMLVVLALGVAVVQLGDALETTSSAKQSHTFTLWQQTVGWAAMLVGSAASGSSGVLIELLNKAMTSRSRKPPMWVQAAQVSFYTLLFSILLHFVTAVATAQLEATSPDSGGFYRARGRWTWLVTAIVTGQSLGGLLVAYVITNIGNLERLFATSLSIILGFIGDRVAFPRPPHPWLADVFVVAGVGMVLYAIWVFQQQSEAQTPANYSIGNSLDGEGRNERQVASEDKAATLYVPLRETA